MRALSQTTTRARKRRAALVDDHVEVAAGGEEVHAAIAHDAHHQERVSARSSPSVSPRRAGSPTRCR